MPNRASFGRSNTCWRETDRAVWARADETPSPSAMSEEQDIPLQNLKSDLPDTVIG